MPLLDHFHPPLAGPRRWEGFHHSWAALIAQQLNEDVLPPDYYAESEISLGPTLEIDVASIELGTPGGPNGFADTMVWSPPRPKFTAQVDFAHLDSYEVRVFQDLGGGAELRAAIELVSPANKDRAASRRTFAAKCAGYLKHGIGLVIVDVVTSRKANMHEELFRALEARSRTAWKPASEIYAVAYRPVTVRNKPRVEVWPQSLKLGAALPELPLWLTVDLAVPLDLEASYVRTCRSLRISA